MGKITLPDGGWAQLREPDEVPERLRRPLVNLQRRMAGSDLATALEGVDLEALSEDEQRKLMQPYLAKDDLDMVDEIDDLLLVALVDSWSLDAPVTVAAMLDLPGKVRKPLLEACRPLVGPLSGEVTDDQVLDPNSPTEPANGSGSH